MANYFKPGEIVVIKGIDLGGKLASIVPSRIVEDSELRTVLYTCEGTPVIGWNPLLERIDDPGWQIDIKPKKWLHTDFVAIHYPDRMYSVWPMWKMPEGKFQCWYVNIEMPMKRTVEGFEITDLELDVVIRPDLTWYWKDEDEFARLIELGYFSEKLAAEIRQTGLDAVACLESRSEPFNEPWPEWHPDPEWVTPDVIDPCSVKLD